jgi:hypothetical protein
MIDAFTRAMRKPQQVLGYIPGLTGAQIPMLAPAPGNRLRREPDGPVSLKNDADANVHMPSPFRVGYKIKFSVCLIRSMFGLFFSRAISADRRGIEPDTYVFQVPEHEEGPLGPLTLTDRRGNIRRENSFRFR